MKNLLMPSKISIGLIICALLSVAHSSYAYEENRDLKGFTKISFNISGDLHLTQGSAFSVKVVGSEADVKKILTKIEGESVIIKVERNQRYVGDIKVYVTLPKLKALSLAGSGDVHAKSSFETGEFNVSVSGSGDINFDNLKAGGGTNISIAGSGDIRIAGSSRGDVNVSITGSGEVMAADYKADEVNVNISGSGKAKVHASDKLNTNIIGSGSVLYKGKPLINAHSVGSGKTRAL